jgi:hypothetical protein
VAPSAAAWGPPRSSQDLCARCAFPLDSQHFDESSIVELPVDAGRPIVGRSIVLARFTLPPQYCGVLEYFSQYTNRLVTQSRQVETEGLEWMVLSNGRPLAPYLGVEWIVNPWGSFGFPLAIRLEESTTVELVVRNRDYTRPAEITRVGGRIGGRYWYDVAEGRAAR